MVFSFKKTGAHLQSVSNIYAKFQVICLKTVGRFDYKNSVYGQRPNFNVLEGYNFVKNDFYLFKLAHAYF